MPHPSEPRLLVLQGLRLKGAATADLLAALYGLDPEVVAKELEAARVAGAVRHREGVITGWSLTTAGRELEGSLVADELDRAGARPVVEQAYADFLALNKDTLAACTRWQLRDGALNRHDDPAYDRGVVADLAELCQRSVPVTEALADALDRFGSYKPRLAEAVRKVEAGDGEWFTKPVIDSYHTVWFELHEDLLSTLGRERASEGTG